MYVQLYKISTFVKGSVTLREETFLVNSTLAAERLQPSSEHGTQCTYEVEPTNPQQD